MPRLQCDDKARNSAGVDIFRRAGVEVLSDCPEYALIKAGNPLFLTENRAVQDVFKQLLFQIPQNTKTVHAHQNRGIVFDDLMFAFVAIEIIFAHVTTFIAQGGELAHFFLRGCPTDMGLQLGCLIFENIKQNFVRGVGAVNFLNRIKHLGGEIAVFGGEELLGDFGQAIGFFRTSHSFGAAPGVEVAIAFEGDAVLLYAHVGEAYTIAELGDGQSLASFDFG